jgi:glycosyltransferase involved in cell wall biosynthesis
MVGNLRVVHKGQDIVLEILSSHEWKKRNWHLNIYGNGEDEKYLKDLVKYYQLNERVTFHGKVNDIRAVWENNHILLMPSHMEGMPLAVVEAMLCGRPCVATDVGGISEWIEEDKSGFIAEAPTIASFGNAMEKAWSRLSEWETMGRNAHERAMQLYDPNPGKTLLKLITEST